MLDTYNICIAIVLEQLPLGQLSPDNCPLENYARRTTSPLTTGPPLYIIIIIYYIMYIHYIIYITNITYIYIDIIIAKYLVIYITGGK